MEGSPPPYDQDLEHLRLLVLFHKIVAGIYIVVGLCGLPHFTIGLLMNIDPTFMESPTSPPPPGFVGWIFMGFAAMFVFGAWVFAILNWLSSHRLQQRNGLKLIYATSGLNCLWMPIGTALGVFTFIVITRPSVRSLFPQ